MAKTGFLISYIVRPLGADLNDLLVIHQKQFPGNKLALWSTSSGTVIKVSHVGEVSAKSFSAAVAEVGYSEPI
jgi:hypothetical protein